ncbi:hypothetical protein BH10PAT1_BH10PAT1_0140 [soil metagenome]
MVSKRKKLISVAIIVFAIPLTVYFTIQGIKYFSRASANPVNLTFSQNPFLVNPNTPSSVNLVLDAGTNKIGFTEVEFTFDKTKINMTSEISTTTSLKKIIKQTTMAEANSTGIITLVLGLDPVDIASPPTGAINLASLSFKSISNGSSNLTFNPTNIQIVDMSANALTVNSTNSVANPPTSLPSPTESPIGVPTSLDFDVKFQGIINKGPDKQIALSLKKSTSSLTEVRTLTITSDNNGVYTGISTPADPGTYDVYVKEPNHLQRRFANITFSGEVNTEDWTSPQMLAGDFNNDNKINILDIGLILSQYTALSIPVTSANIKYDINNDGVINITDIASVLSNYTQLEVLGD